MKCKVTYTGSTPGTDSNVYTLFDSTALVGAGKFSLQNMPWAQRLMLSLKNSAAGTLKLYGSNDNGTNWNQVVADTAVAASAASAAANTYDFLLGEYRDAKLTWTNGGTAQSTWSVQMSLLDSHVTAI